MLYTIYISFLVIHLVDEIQGLKDERQHDDAPAPVSTPADTSTSDDLMELEDDEYLSDSDDDSTYMTETESEDDILPEDELASQSAK